MADLTITASSCLPGATGIVFAAYPAGAELTAGTAVYLDNSSVWQKISASSATGTEITRIFGIVLNHAYAGQYVAVAIKDADLTLGATLVTGTNYVASATAGGIAPFSDLVAGKYVVILGVAKSATKLNLSPLASGAPI